MNESKSSLSDLEQKTMDRSERGQSLDKSEQGQFSDKLEQGQSLDKSKQSQSSEKSEQGQFLDKSEQDQSLDKSEHSQSSDESMQSSSVDPEPESDDIYYYSDEVSENDDHLNPFLCDEYTEKGGEDNSGSLMTDEDSDENSGEEHSLSSDSSSLLSETTTESNSLSTDYSDTDGSLSSLISDTHSYELSDESSSDDDDEPHKEKGKETLLSSMQFAKLIFGVKPGEEGDATFVRNYAVILWGRDHLAKSSVPGVEPNSKEKPRPPLDKEKLDRLKKEWFYYKVMCESMGEKKFDEADVKRRQEKIDGILGELVRKLAKQRRLKKKVKR